MYGLFNINFNIIFFVTVHTLFLYISCPELVFIGDKTVYIYIVKFLWHNTILSKNLILTIMIYPVFLFPRRFKETILCSVFIDLILS